MLFKTFRKLPHELRVFGSFFVGLILVFYLYYFSTRFTSVITVKKDDIVKTNGRYARNMIGAESGAVYKVSTNILIGAFSATELLNRIEEGRTYRITGYGRRVPVLGMYPTIVSAEEVF